LGYWDNDNYNSKRKKKKEKDGYLSGIFHGRRKLVNKPFFFSLGF
jgi:hypothetical protein